MKPVAVLQLWFGHRLALVLAIGLFAHVVCAQPSAAQPPVAKPSAAGSAVPAASSGLGAQIEEVFQEHYLATEFDAAEAGLLALIQGCDASCARGDLARAWMYIGIVRGGGRQDAEGAKEAFEQALALNPKVELDARVANPETAAFYVAAGGKAPGVAPAKPAVKPDEPRPEAELR